MNRIVCRDADAVAEAAADRIVAAVRADPGLSLCLPTGRTPLAVYRRLIADCRAGKVSFAQAAIFILDEYVGLGAGDPGGFATYIAEALLDHVDADRGRCFAPDGKAGDMAAEAARYEGLIAAYGGIDLMVLGVGRNGHIGFNEPGSPRGSRTRVIALAPDTLVANAADWPAGRTPPDRAITIGLGTIMDARRILVIAHGATKAEPLGALFRGGLVEDWPVAVLRDHPDVTVLCDPVAVGEA
ncbi:MAG: glucosamine-6-phosphate deaminase [Alphaproteobacteria bacterium]